MDTRRMAFTMLKSTRSTTAMATSSGVMASSSPRRPREARAAAASSCISPPKKLPGLMRPSATLASVTVASVPPRR